MFGYLTAAAEQLSPDEFIRYRACYCGLCRSLHERHGALSRMTLNYDMTFLVLLLDSLYEPEQKEDEERCPVHPLKPRLWQRSACTDYAADLNLALAYLKCRDDWQDDGSVLALARAEALKAAYSRVLLDYPRQCEALRSGLETLHELERNRAEDPDAASAAFGSMMGELFVWREDRWRDALRGMGDALGRFLYMMDACMDLDADAARDRYNPLRRFYGLSDNEERFRGILKMLLGDCLYYFDKLPLVKDASILKNVLCIGLWTQFNRKIVGKKGKTDGTGPL